MKRYLIYIILILTACLYRLGVDNYYLGCYNDDAAYILRSENFLYAITKSFPPFLVIPQITIGFPIVLLPAAFLSYWFRYDFYQIYMFFLILTTIYVIYRWLLRETDYFTAITTCLLLSFCPLFSWVPTKVMPEIPFTLCCILIWIVLNKWQRNRLGVRSEELGVKNYKEQKIKQILYAGLVLILAVFSFLIRGEGFLIIIIAIFFLLKNSNKFLRKFLLLFGMVILLVGILSFHIWGGIIKNYLVGIYAQYGQDLNCIFDNVFYNIKYFLNVVISSWIFYLEIIPIKWLSFLLKTIILLLLTRGIHKEITGYGLKPHLLFFIGYILIHLVWVTNETRYWQPILPYFIFYLIKGTSSLGSKKTIASYFLLIILGLTMIKPNYDIVRKSLFAPEKPTYLTYRWIKNNLARKGPISSYTVFRDYLYTRKFFIPIPRGIEPQIIIAKLKQQKIKYFFIDLETDPISSFSRRTTSDHPCPRELAAYIEKDLDIKKIYENIEEQTIIYQIN